MTKAARGSLVVAALNDELKMKPGVAERSARAIRLKNELSLMLELVVKIRKRLELELDDAVSAKFINKEYVTKLKDLSHTYEQLTKCRIALDKAERTMEDDMTPQQEIQAVRDLVASLEGDERGELIRTMWHAHLKARHPTQGRPAGPLPETYEELPAYVKR